MPGCGGWRRSASSCAPRHRLIGLPAEGGARFTTPDGGEILAAGAIVLALGGASWPRLGSDGGWVGVLRAAGIAIAPLQPANSGFLVEWSTHFRERFEGAPLKAFRWTHGKSQSRAEAVVTAGGLEGGAIYALSASLRAAIEAEGAADLPLDFKPDASPEALARRLVRSPGQSLPTFLRKAVSLSPVAIGLLREAGFHPGRPGGAGCSAEGLPAARRRRRADRARDFERGRRRMVRIDKNFMLHARPGVFVAAR